MRRRLAALLVASALVPAALVAAGSAPASGTPVGGLGHLVPGGPPAVAETVPVNVVLVGLRPGDGAQQVDPDRLVAGLPAEAAPVVRVPELYYGVTRPLGETWRYRYRVTWATPAFESALWSELAALARPAPLTTYQQTYDAQRSRALDVDGNEVIDARAAEWWLAANAPAMLGVDTTEDTVFYLDWYGRPGFRFHVYDVPHTDLDTGFDTGTRETNKVVAFGGTPPADGGGPASRVWFDDVSAGPDAETRGYDLDDVDIPGWTPGAYRLPPVWEYGNPRPAQPHDDLTGDLARVTRYVALDLLFTPSPLYSPVLPPAVQPRTIRVDTTVEDVDWAGAVPDGGHIAAALDRLEPWRTFSSTTAVRDGDVDFDRVYDCFVSATTATPHDCYGHSFYGTPYDDILLYYLDHRSELTSPGVDLDVPVIDVRAADHHRIGLGFTDDDWRTGTQTYILGMLWPDAFRLGYGPTGTYTHEMGHYLGLSHTHDGYDAGAGEVNAADARYGYVYLGDEVDSVMSYLDTSSAFSQFDGDSAARWSVVAYLGEADRVLAAIDASPRAAEVADAVRAADAEAGAGLADLDARRFSAAAASLADAYDGVVAAARRVGVVLEPASYQGATRPGGGHEFQQRGPIGPYQK